MAGVMLGVDFWGEGKKQALERACGAGDLAISKKGGLSRKTEEGTGRSPVNGSSGGGGGGGGGGGA